MDSRMRILDANANRAREALRVMEDVARFVLDDAGLCGELKGVRHALRDSLGRAVAGCGGEAAMLAWRDTPGDVGTRVGTESEGQRAGVRDVAAAAGKRLSEALRVIEEVAKTLDADAAGEIEGLRYRGYECERRVMAGLGTGRGVQWGVCVLITERLCTHHSWEEVARQAVRAGAECVQLREKELGDAGLLRRARRLVEVVRSGGGPESGPTRPAAIVNDRPDIALLAGADGVHVGQDDLPVREVRRTGGDRLIVGVSTHTIEQAMRAAAEGADYCGVGPMYSTATKEAGAIAGPGYLREYLGTPQTARVPHLAIGGITERNISELIAAGCRGIAVSSAVCGAREPGEVCAELVRLVRRG